MSFQNTYSSDYGEINVAAHANQIILSLIHYLANISFVCSGVWYNTVLILLIIIINCM